MVQYGPVWSSKVHTLLYCIAKKLCKFWRIDVFKHDEPSCSSLWNLICTCTGLLIKIIVNFLFQNHETSILWQHRYRYLYELLWIGVNGNRQEALFRGPLAVQWCCASQSCMQQTAGCRCGDLQHSSHTWLQFKQMGSELGFSSSEGGSGKKFTIIQNKD